jgi:serine/threonine protein kinase
MMSNRLTLDPFGIVGTVVDGRYRVERVAGQGGFGVVYRAWHLGFESPIALKVLKLPESWSIERKQARVTSFQREGRMLFELSALHPAIVRAFETGTVAGPDGSPAPYLSLEWLEGASLDHELKQRRKQGVAAMTLPEVLGLLHGPAEGLARAHARGIVHRDVKPGNLFVTMQGDEPYVKILDFGIAKVVDGAADTTAQYAATAGSTASFTAMYAAPEQWLERLGATGTWTDVHALALVCVELLTGSIPFAGREPVQFMAACLDPALRPTPKSRGVELAADVESVFAKAIALHPRERFRDVGAFWRALCEAARWSPDRAMAAAELVSVSTRTNSATDAPAILPVKEGAFAIPPSAETTATAATLASRRAFGARHSSRSKWLRRSAIAIALAGVSGYVAIHVDQMRTRAGNAASVPPSPDPRLLAPNELPASRTAGAPRAPSSSPAADSPPVSVVGPPKRGRSNALREHTDMPRAPKPLDLPSAPVSDGVIAEKTPAPAASVTSAPSSQAAPVTSSDEPMPSVNYDDPALMRRR